MRTVGKRALRRTPGGDLLVGILATSVGFTVTFGIETVAATRSMPLEVALVRAIGVPFIAFLSVPFFAGIYARVARDDATEESNTVYDRFVDIQDGRLRETVRLAAATLQSRGRTLFCGLGMAVIASLVVGLLTVLALHAIVLTLLTIAGYVSNGLGYGQLLPATTTIRISGMLVGLGLAIGVIAVRFFDCVVCWTDAGPVASVRESLRFTRVRPLTVVGYALVTTVLFALPVVGSMAIAALHTEVVALGALVLFSSASFALYANFHAHVCHQRVLPVCCATESSEELSPTAGPPERTPVPSYSVRHRPLVDNPVPIVLAILLVTALLVGSGLVRALDARPVDMPNELGPIDELDDSDGLVSPEVMPRQAVNHGTVEAWYTYNESQERWVETTQFRYESDHEQRRYLASFTSFDDDGEPAYSNTIYVSTKHFAMNATNLQDPRTPSAPPVERDWYQRTAGDWVVYSVAGVELFDEGNFEPVTPPGFFEQDWQVVDESNGTVTLAVEGSGTVPMHEASFESVDDAVVELTLDRETGYAVEVFQEVHVDGAAGPTRTYVTFEKWGEHEVDRPADIEDVRALEWLWAVASY